MIRDYSVLYLARVVLEAATPLSVSTGSPDGVFDTALVCDANGLPAIPGTSLAGVLRRLWAESDESGVENDLFGYQHRREGRPSRVRCTWGALLDSHGSPAEGLLLGEAARRLQEDPLYASVIAAVDAPVFRNRVRLSHRGAASDQGKFDRAVLPAGHRFALELRLWGRDDADGEHWRRLLDLLGHPGLRLGGATRAGLGRMDCVRVVEGRFDLRDPAEAASFRRLGRGLGETDGLRPYSPVGSFAGWRSGTLTLKARGLWRIGQGSEDLQEAVEKPADLLPVTEERVDWSNGRGERRLGALLIPAASVKGALAHRMAFHARRLAEEWLEDQPQVDEAESPAAVRALLGEVKDKRSPQQVSSGRAGCLFIDDAFLPVEPKQIARLMHNAIDRFTGGVRNRVLFEEESLLGGELKLRIDLDRSRLERAGDQIESARNALRATLEDLTQGRLALGSRTTTGNGLFEGRLEGTLAEWLNGEAKDTTAEVA